VFKIPTPTRRKPFLLPREEFPDAPLRRAAAQVNRLIRDCADGEHIVYAGIGDVLLDSDGRLGAALSRFDHGPGLLFAARRAVSASLRSARPLHLMKALEARR
jgi:hypothetical protein